MIADLCFVSWLGESRASLRDVTLGMPFVVGWLLGAVWRSLGSLFRVLTASDVEVPLGQNLETCVNPRARWYMAEGALCSSGSQSQSLLNIAPASRECDRELGVSIRREISVPPTRCSSNEIVLVGRSPAPRGFFLCIHYLHIYFVTWRKYPGRLLYVL